MLAELSLPNRDNAPLDDDVISILSHVVESSFHKILDKLHARLLIRLIAGPYSEEVSLHPNFDPELIAEKLCECIAIPTEFLTFDLNHQHHTRASMLDGRPRAARSGYHNSKVAFRAFGSSDIEPLLVNEQCPARRQDCDKVESY